MNCCRRLLIVLVAGMAMAMPARGQDDDAAKPTKAKAKPAAKAKPEKPAFKPGGKLDYTPPEDPAIAALLATNPRTPAEWAQTAQTLSKLQRPELAKTFLKKILAANLDDQQLAGLAQQFGTSAFTELSLQPDLLPEAEQLAQAVLGAVTRQAQDPRRVAGLVRQLQDPSQEARAKALAGLREAHGAAIAALVAILADPARAAERPVAKAALAAMRGDTFEPLVSILDRAEPELAVQIIETLAAMKSPGAAIYLVGPALGEGTDPAVRAAAKAALVRLLGAVPDRRQAAQWVSDRATSYFRQKPLLKVDPDGRVTVWQWDPARKQCVARNCSVDDASRALAARLARAASALSPGDNRARRLELVAMLDDAVSMKGLDKSLDPEKDVAAREAAAAGAGSVEAALSFAMAEHHTGAARAAAEILGRIGKARDLLRQGAEPAPLVRALRDPDRRLRLAAAEAIVRLQPDGPFPGSSYVIEALDFFAATSGARRAILASPNPESLEQWLGVLSTMHIDADAAAIGRDVVRLAVSSPDYELVLIDPGIRNPEVERVVDQLRQDYRTAALRIAVVARSGYFERAERIAHGDPLTVAFARPHTPEAAQWQMRQLAAAAPRDFVAFPERQEEAARALACLATLASSSKNIYDMRRVEGALRAAEHAPQLGGRVAAVLASLGTRESQVALVELASRSAEPVEVRKVAVKALGVSLLRFGVLLPDDLIRRQYERYDKSVHEDMATQQVLGAILDQIEARTGPSSVAPKPKPAAKTPPAKEAKPGKKNA